jgi:hypothetical protein
MNNREAAVKLSLVVDILRGNDRSQSLNQLVQINLLEVKKYLDILGAVSAPAAPTTKLSGGKLRSRISKLEAENVRLKESLGKTSRIVLDVVKAGEAPNRYIPAEVLHRARELQMRDLGDVKPKKKVAKRRGKKKGKK